eukprot:scaffold269512_cov31-Tisochrysis_lutea.AAC.1
MDEALVGRLRATRDHAPAVEHREDDADNVAGEGLEQIERAHHREAQGGRTRGKEREGEGRE